MSLVITALAVAGGVVLGRIVGSSFFEKKKAPAKAKGEGDADAERDADAGSDADAERKEAGAVKERRKTEPKIELDGFARWIHATPRGPRSAALLERWLGVLGTTGSDAQA